MIEVRSYKCSACGHRYTVWNIGNSPLCPHVIECKNMCRGFASTVSGWFEEEDEKPQIGELVFYDGTLMEAMTYYKNYSQN